MGTDLLSTVVKTTPKLSRDAIRELIVEVWSARGARLETRAAPNDAVWRADDQKIFGYAVSRASKRGWVTIIESAEDGLRIDEEVLERLRDETAVWVAFGYDHAGIHGQKAFTKLRDPVDFASDAPFSSLLDYPDEWDFFVLSGVCPLDFERFAPTERTKSDPLPRDPERELDSKLTSAILAQDLDEALALVEKLGANVSDGALRRLFEPSYPLKWPETRDTILKLGAAIARHRPLGAEHWVRMLETAAVADDERAARDARDALARSDPAETEAALHEARDRLRDGGFGAAGKRFARWSRPKD